MRIVLWTLFFLNFFTNILFSGEYIIGHLTTSTGLINNYPADSVNWFYRDKHKVIQYFAYILFPLKQGNISLTDRTYLFINPYEYYSEKGRYYDETEYYFENKWVSPSGKVICEKVVTWTKTNYEKKININNKTYIPYIFSNFIGIKNVFSENGQEELPTQKGLYHIDLYINGELASITFFEMKD